MANRSKPGQAGAPKTQSTGKKIRARSSSLLGAFLVLALLVSSCSPQGVFWVPPSSASANSQGAEVPGAALIPSTFTPEPTAVDPPVTPAGQEGVPVAAIETLTQAPVLPVQDTPLPAGLPDPTATPEDPPASQGTPPPTIDASPYLYYAQAADTLPAVAVRFGVRPEEITSTTPLDPAALLTPGQLLIIPRRLANTTSAQHTLPDSEVVYSPSATDFDINAYVAGAGGKLSTYQDWLKSSGLISGAQVVQRVALENSINPRLLLALMEYQSHWVLGQPGNQTDATYAIGPADPGLVSLYSQLVWAVNQLSVGYYAWREGRLNELKFSDGVIARLAPDLNAGSAAVQYYFAQLYDSQRWLQAVDPQNGLPALYERMFGSPWERAQRVEPLYPPGLTQPPMILPFVMGDFWSFTGGPHGAWEHDGSYAALDFAPPSTQSGCVESNVWAVAAAAGLVVRSGSGVVVLDLDGDGHEQTGWVLLYLHLSTENRIPVGSWVDTGTPLGHPSCEGGLATGTHLHLARKYNGEWIAAAGPMPFVLSGWVAQAGPVAYQGRLVRNDQVVDACTCSSAKTRIGRSPEDP